MKSNKDKFVLAFAALFPLLMLIGVVKNYSPVPYWDMWNGTLSFYISALNGDWSIWLSQHNEHRIVFARLLFFIDNYLFNGTAEFLIFSNVVLLSLIFVCLIKIQRKLIDDKFDRVVLFCATTAFIFSWSQHENIIWGFQSQFLAAYLFPLVAFYSLVAYKATKQNLYYFVALLFGVASVGAMGNGVAALPILLVLAAVLQLKKKYFLGVFVIAVITLGFHFYYYKTPPFHQPMLEGLINDPVQAVLFLLTYLGAPFYYISGSLIVSSAFGLMLILGCLLATYLYFFKSGDDKNYYTLALLAILLYIGASAFGTTGARSIAGVSAATSSRYLTASLVAWVALFTIYLHHIGAPAFKKYLRIFLLILPVLMLPYQSKAFHSKTHELYERYIAILALELNVKDDAYLVKVFPFIDWLVTMSHSIKDNDLSVFKDPLFSGASESMRSKVVAIPVEKALGHLDRSEDIEGVTDYVRVIGWFMDGGGSQGTIRLNIVNDKHEVVGYALTGSERPDVAQAHGSIGMYAGFIGYMLRSEMSGDFFIIDAQHNSVLKINI
ncbi:MAG: hypothetical protein KAS57_06655 [Gammaproteobacteria bacterium]|nr:hypothetical protein [Gammaproteobacteria bacterium]